jgi:peptidoglycan hydrolase-like protein with peptidoglycan-binding domain
MMSAGTAAADTESGGAAYAAGTSAAKQAEPRHLGDRSPLRRGMKGQDIRVLQDFLSRLGLTVKVVGTFGPKTLKQVRRFEARAATTRDGVLDAGEISLLRKYVESGGFPPPPPPAELPPGSKAKVLKNGLAAAPADAPAAVKAIIAAGNRIASKPYRYGGGHGRWNDTGYDCSGSVSYALHGAKLLNTQLDSGSLMSWGKKGRGKWVTVYAHGGHTYMVVAGLRFDTSGLSSAGSRWQADMRSTRGYAVRHPAGL